MVKLPSTKEFIKIYKLQTDKKLGQNFLYDDSVTDLILNHMGSLAGKTVLEIGPGPGGLTRSILHQKPDKLVCVEYDQRLDPILSTIRASSDDVMELVYADALRWDENQLPGKVTVIANLPYNIGTQLILKWLYNYKKFESITVMLQKEVALRIAAQTSDNHYGRLSILTNLIADTEVLMELEPELFFPPPKVNSAVVRITPKTDAPDFNFDILERVTNTAFAHRRKKIRTSLSPLLAEQDFVTLGLDENLRAEDVSPAEYLRVVKFLEGKK